jgi:hypothetical protein
MTVLAVILLYVLPTIIALCRHHRSAAAIALVNLLLGWSVIGWFFALIWSLANSGRQAGVQQTVQVVMVPSTTVLPSGTLPATLAPSATVLPTTSNSVQ